MVSLTALWLPILLSGVIVFIASSILHMVLPFHKKDYKKVPGEEKILEVMREIKVPPGNYVFPCPDNAKHMNTPEMLEKYNKGPVAFLTVMPNAVPNMPKHLAQWFLYSLFVGVLVAYMASRTVVAGAEYLTIFRVAGTTAFIAYSVAHISNFIWKGDSCSLTFKQVVDGLVYGLLVAGVFAWLWPEM